MEMVRPARFERTTACLEGRCSIQLSYGRNRVNSSVDGGRKQGCDAGDVLRVAYCVKGAIGRLKIILRTSGVQTRLGFISPEAHRHLIPIDLEGTVKP
jgi:hypothetical protein